jgi:phage shock protein PspC (stress-responsive transcriptional regulator)
MDDDGGMATPEIPAPLCRPRQGRVLGGVCAGLAARWDLPAGRVRAAFVLATPVFGVGPLVYLACWLIVPAEGEDGSGRGVRGIVLLAQACGALVALVALALLAAAATVFGYGWIVVAVGAAVLVGTLAGWPRVAPGWALLPIGALVLPSVALAVGGLHVDPRSEPVSLAPRTAADLPAAVHSGLGLVEVDLRHTALPPSGTIALRVDAGLRRTLVALPHDRCVRVEVRRRAVPVAARFAAAALGSGLDWAPDVTVFGVPRRQTRVTGPVRATRPGPTLRLDFSSDGGPLVVRDYPDDVDPGSRPDWPGYVYDAGPRPRLHHASRKTRHRVLRSWLQVLRQQREIRRLMGGPCARPQKKANGRSKRAAHRKGHR